VAQTHRVIYKKVVNWMNTKFNAAVLVALCITAIYSSTFISYSLLNSTSTLGLLGYSFFTMSLQYSLISNWQWLGCSPRKNIVSLVFIRVFIGLLIHTQMELSSCLSAASKFVCLCPCWQTLCNFYRTETFNISTFQPPSRFPWPLLLPILTSA